MTEFKQVESVTVIFLEHDECLIAKALDQDTALTLWAVMSEDPADWQEVSSFWSRYQTSVVCESVDLLPFETCSIEEAQSAIADHDEWLVLDLKSKRILAGAGLNELDRDAVLSMSKDEADDDRDILPIHLPPWWELHNKCDSCKLTKSRETPLAIPFSDRSFLYGRPLIEEFASRIRKAASSGQLPKLNEDDDDNKEVKNARYQLKVEIHRDWLMTPRDELDGRKPRDLLHGAHHWSDLVIERQQMRFHFSKRLVAGPAELLNDNYAPMGREEMIIYFDLCRELIDAGWRWCDNPSDEHGKACDIDSPEILERFLEDVRDLWFTLPFEGGSSPQFIVECSRRRVPRGAGVAIDGMDEQESEDHVIDCDCPICEMMADGSFGVGFSGLDGHHLDLDDEFAFSTYETMEDWEESQSDYLEFAESMDRKTSERSAGIAEDKVEDDEFDSVWDGITSEGPIPGDTRGHMKLAFLLAEVIGDLEFANAPKAHIKALNSSFRTYREDDDVMRFHAKQDLFESLELTGKLYPKLLPKVVDLQAKIDELERVTQNGFGGDLPF